MNLENPTSLPPVNRAEFKATSNRDYRRQPLPSPFGAEIKCFFSREGALKWLQSLGVGGSIDAWNEETKRYEHRETVAAAEAATK